MEESKKKSAIQCHKLIEFLAYDSILIVLCLTLKSHLRDMFLLIFEVKGPLHFSFFKPISKKLFIYAYKKKKSFKKNKSFNAKKQINHFFY
jgi:hypothetical protein